jgi:hypothetical protein
MNIIDARNYARHRQAVRGVADEMLLAYADALYLDRNRSLLAAAVGADTATIRSEAGLYLAEVDHGGVLLSDAWRQLGWPRPEASFLTGDAGPANPRHGPAQPAGPSHVNPPGASPQESSTGNTSTKDEMNASTRPQTKTRRLSTVNVAEAALAASGGDSKRLVRYLTAVFGAIGERSILCPACLAEAVAQSVLVTEGHVGEDRPEDLPRTNVPATKTLQ